MARKFNPEDFDFSGLDPKEFIEAWAELKIELKKNRRNKMPLRKGESNLDYCYNPLPKCPHCDNKDVDWWDGTRLTWDGDEEVQECGNCGNKYKVTMHISYTFSTDFVEEE